MQSSDGGFDMERKHNGFSVVELDWIRRKIPERLVNPGQIVKDFGGDGEPGLSGKTSLNGRPVGPVLRIALNECY